MPCICSRGHGCITCLDDRLDLELWPNLKPQANPPQWYLCSKAFNRSHTWYHVFFFSLSLSRYRKYHTHRDTHKSRYVYVYIYMYMSVYVRTYVYTFVCTYVCMYACMYVCMYGTPRRKLPAHMSSHSLPGIAGISHTQANAADYQRLFYCAPPGGKWCGLPPCSGPPGNALQESCGELEL